METRLKRIEIALIILTVLTIFNVVQPYLNFSSNNLENEPTATIEKDLPPDLPKDRTNKIVYDIKIAFNQEDWEKMRSVFGELAQAQFSKEELEQEFSKLKPIMGDIGTYAYSHYVYEGYSDGADWFEIHYKCRFDNGKGTIKVSTRTMENISEVTGININLDGV